ncbi:MAG: heavy metal sensor histidine kinase [Chthoniobacterales bacterium]|nr:heavy metal sensor histidine kinase [Chthoniobacterales bacterium]
MSSSPTEPRSIASQLVLLFAVAAALLLFCGLGVLYWIVVRHAFEEDNEVLADKVFALRADLQRAGDVAGLNEELKILRRDERVPYLVRILDPAGEVVAETPAMNRLLSATNFPPPQERSGAKWRANDVRAGGRLFSCVSVREEIAGKSYTVQVAQDRSADERFMRQFATLIAAVLAIGTVASALIAITVTRRGLRPIGRMTESLQRVGPHRLDERLTPVGWPRELQPLAAGFDDMLDRLEHSFTRLSQFSADLAHELRTPVANIRGESEVALTRSRSADEYREVIESTVGECERLSRTIDNLLFLARAEAAEPQIEGTRFEGRAALDKIVGYYQDAGGERQVSITAGGEGEIFADPLLFGRAVSNLIDNALRATPAGGTIQIALRPIASATEISVTDTGSGIEAEDLPRVFDRFYRGDRSRSSDGTGLGLSLVKSIAEMHGGKANITSAPGAGTTVTLTFPA